MLPPNVIEDTLAFRGEVDGFLAGHTSPEEFKGIRVHMGIYEQRVDNTYMVRIRAAAGAFTSGQAKLVADLSERFGNGTVHVTTRQDLQLHGVSIRHAPDVVEALLTVGLSTRGGGGDTVRNVTACPCAGACPNEVFDVTPYALALTDYLLSDQGSFSLPRKFKVAFSGCPNDCAMCSVADLGFFAHERDGVRGFSVWAGGGMGVRSTLALKLEEFVEDEAVFEVTEAVKRLFDKHGDRTNRRKARLRFVVERVGPDEFRRMYQEELAAVGSETLRRLTVTPSETSGDVTCVPVKLKMGDISAADLRGLAKLAESVGGGILRATQSQDLQLRSPDAGSAERIRVGLRELDPALAASKSMGCVSCVGASTCRTGMCDSRGLAEALEAELAGIELPFEAVVRISGCPNACGQHPIAPLGLYGAPIRVDGALEPHYVITAGGRLGEGRSQLAQPVAKLPARDIPTLLRDLLIACRREHVEGESFGELMARWGVGYLDGLVARNGVLRT